MELIGCEAGMLSSKVFMKWAKWQMHSNSWISLCTLKLAVKRSSVKGLLQIIKSHYHLKLTKHSTFSSFSFSFLWVMNSNHFVGNKQKRYLILWGMVDQIIIPQFCAFPHPKWQNQAYDWSINPGLINFPIICIWFRFIFSLIGRSSSTCSINDSMDFRK